VSCGLPATLTDAQRRRLHPDQVARTVAATRSDLTVTCTVTGRRLRLAFTTGADDRIDVSRASMLPTDVSLDAAAAAANIGLYLLRFVLCHGVGAVPTMAAPLPGPVDAEVTEVTEDLAFSPDDEERVALRMVAELTANGSGTDGGGFTAKRIAAHAGRTPQSLTRALTRLVRCGALVAQQDPATTIRRRAYRLTEHGRRLLAAHVPQEQGRHEHG
jgi:hypothetical protein